MRTWVLDTNALLRILFSPSDLTRLGRAIVELAQEYMAVLVIPALALVELEYELRRRKQVAVAFDRVLDDIEAADYLRVEPLGVDQLRAMPRLLHIPEMHDRIIVAHAVTNDAPLMTCDQVIRDSKVVETVW